ncbi:MAG: nickel-dependent hydrogenase large subunit [Micrococcales bacterium]|nr:nickel-dependent hydrogenase large subunit [Micrococcales bacterium]
MSQRWVLDEIVDAYGATVVVERDERGRPQAARFDLAGLPRVDALLAGKPVASVPTLVERLCGICPEAHHLAGVRALEMLVGAEALTPTAVAVRALLHHGSALETHAARMVAADPEGAAALRDLGQAAMAAAGSPGHFPVTAVVGGVRAPVVPEARDALAARLDAVRAAAARIARHELAQGGRLEPYTGADVALVDADGRPDLLGERLRVVAADGSVLEAAAPASAWDRLVAESVPGATAPRPYLVALGQEAGGYRVGPVPQLRVGTLTTPLAARLQADWADVGGGARAARAIVALHSVEAIGQLLTTDALVDGPPAVAVGGFDQAAVGVGWADGPRGLLVHRYATDGDGTLMSATILTPTAQNERWLADLLLSAVGAQESGTREPRTGEPSMEAAIREADPCLPCTSAPVGGMGLRVESVAAEPVAASAPESQHHGAARLQTGQPQTGQPRAGQPQERSR